MADEQRSIPEANQQMVYQIRIKGHLGQQWMDWFEGLTISLEADGNTLLSGIVIDQSALHGMLKKVRDLGMPLLSVNPIGPKPQDISKQEIPMSLPIFQLDAFTTCRFAGNPAAVVLLQKFPEVTVMQNIAAENNLAETAFLVPADGEYHIRWFTPTVEVPLCGHATLASAAVVMERLEPVRTKVIFHSASGLLTVSRCGNVYVMDFPSRFSEQIDPPSNLAEALGVVPREVFSHPLNYLALVDSASTVRTLSPDLAAIARMDRTGVIVTARGDETYDFVSRYFAPAKGIPEDPVTGGAHCMLTPYWAKKLGKTDFHAFQASQRGGEIICRLKQGRVELEGSCVFYLEGKVEV